MGQPAVDLPDPLQASTAETAQNADDLLAQLAGDEIDRLLAEADEDGGAPLSRRPAPADDAPADQPAAAATSTAAVATPPADLGDGPDGSKVDQYAVSGTPSLDLPAAEAQDAVTAAAVTAAENAALTEPVDEAADLPADALEAADTTAAAEVEPVSAGAAVAEPDSAAAALDAELAADERETATPTTSASLPAVLDEVLSAPAEVDEPAPLLVRPLYWLNKPFEHLSDDTRSFLGKVAIITLLNAVAVLCYVLFLRG